MVEMHQGSHGHMCSVFKLSYMLGRHMSLYELPVSVEFDDMGNRVWALTYEMLNGRGPFYRMFIWMTHFSLPLYIIHRSNCFR